jgi:hypothetical protein
MEQPDPPKPNRRLSRRRAPKNRLRAICQRGGLELGPNLALGVLDLSETGVRLRVKEALRAGQEVSICLESSASVRPVKRIGNVAWCAPAPEGGDCWVGVNFQKRLDYRDYLDLT